MLDFDPRHFESSFNSNPYYNGKINGFDVMVMESEATADRVISTYKKIINDMVGTDIYSITLDYDKTDILDLDQRRIEREVKEYGALKGIYVLTK